MYGRKKPMRNMDWKRKSFYFVTLLEQRFMFFHKPDALTSSTTFFLLSPIVVYMTK